MKQTTKLALALSCVTTACLNQILTAHANAQLLEVTSGMTTPTAVAVTTTVANSGFFSASNGDDSFVGASYLVFGGGTDAIDVITISTAQFKGKILDDLSITYDIPFGVASGVSGTVAFGTYSNKTYGLNSTYNNYVKPNTYIPSGSFSFLTGVDANRNGQSDITLSGFASAANTAIAAGQDLEIVFQAGAAPFQSLAPSGNYFDKSTAVVNAVEESAVPEPSAIAGMLVAAALMMACLRYRNRMPNHTLQPTAGVPWCPADFYACSESADGN